ncbi:MAG: hypothetical protein HRT61_09415 [Ekhidna sp.]|nr:hypothetical protein [Ekhidna sp.]
MAEYKDDFHKEGDNAPKWLKTIQLNSWEAELLISALVLYALFQVPDFLDNFRYRNFERGSIFIWIFSAIENSIQLLQFGYILHIMVRGIWVASVGFSYVFPKGINTGNLKFKGKFKKELEKNSSFVKSVLKLEELSSMIYGLSFTVFGTFMGISTLLFFYIIVMTYTSPMMPDSFIENEAFFGIFSLIYLICIVLLLIDFITSGLFRRKEWAVDWFYPIAWFFRILTLSFMYRRSMLVLLSNLKGWKSRSVSVIIALVLLGFWFLREKKGDNRVESYYSRTEKSEFISENYESLRNEDDYLLASIQSDIISDSYLKLFLKDISLFRETQDSQWDADEIKWKKQSSDSSSFYLNKLLNIMVDSTEIQTLNWVNAQHPVENFYGFFVYIDLLDIERGPHHLKIVVDSTEMNDFEKNRWKNGTFNKELLANIQFQYDK